MAFKKIFLTVLTIVFLIIGFYLLFTSGYVPTDPFNVVLFLVMAAFFVYLYFMYSRHKQ